MKINLSVIGKRVLQTFVNEPIKFTDVSHDRLNIFRQPMQKWGKSVSLNVTSRNLLSVQRWGGKKRKQQKRRENRN